MVLPPSPPYQLYVGIDVAAATFTASWMTPGTQPTPAVTLTHQQLPLLVQQLHQTGIPANTLIVLEATGSFWMLLALTLSQANFRVSVINPLQAHHFAKALLRRAKTDALDAQVLAQLAVALQPTPWTPPPTMFLELYQRLAQREALLEIRQQLRNQRFALGHLPLTVPSVRERLEGLIRTLDDEIRTLEAEIAEVLRGDHAWAKTVARLQTITGIGQLTAAWIVVATMNFALCQTPEQAAAYAGLVPRRYQSGTSVRRRGRIGHTGHAAPRRALYLATLSATRYNPVIQPFYLRLRAAGKPGALWAKVARCAAARKLLHIAWAVATKDRDFDPALATGRAQQAVAVARA
jgi:transposase